MNILLNLNEKSHSKQNFYISISQIRPIPTLPHQIKLAILFCWNWWKQHFYARHRNVNKIYSSIFHNLVVFANKYHLHCFDAINHKKKLFNFYLNLLRISLFCITNEIVAINFVATAKRLSELDEIEQGTKYFLNCIKLQLVLQWKFKRFEK